MGLRSCVASLAWPDAVPADASRGRPLAVALSAWLASGCAASVGAMASASVDTTGHFGADARVVGEAAVGDPDLRAFVSLAAGGGYLDVARRGLLSGAVELGVEGGRGLRWSAGAGYSPRFFFGGAVPVAHAGLVSGQLLFPLARTGAERGGLCVGVRASAELVSGLGAPDASGAPGAIGLFQLGAVFQWITFDTTANRWAG